jgi:hypothetical protein
MDMCKFLVTLEVSRMKFGDEVLALAVCALTIFAPAAQLAAGDFQSCPVALMESRLSLPPQGALTQFEATSRDSTDGGEWRVWISNGTIRTAIRRDFGESGLATVRYEFISGEALAVEQRREWFIAPVPEGQRPLVQRVEMQRYFVCKDKVVDMAPTLRPTESDKPDERVRRLIDDVLGEPRLRNYLRGR